MTINKLKIVTEQVNFTDFNIFLVESKLQRI